MENQDVTTVKYQHLQIEEDTKFPIEYQPNFLYEWNFDNLSKYQQFNAIQQMAIATTANWSRNKSYIIVARAIVQGFTGKLKDGGKSIP